MGVVLIWEKNKIFSAYNVKIQNKSFKTTLYAIFIAFMAKSVALDQFSVHNCSLGLKTLYFKIFEALPISWDGPAWAAWGKVWFLTRTIGIALCSAFSVAVLVGWLFRPSVTVWDDRKSRRPPIWGDHPFEENPFGESPYVLRAKIGGDPPFGSKQIWANKNVGHIEILGA